MNTWRYRLPLAAFVVLVLLLGHAVMRRPTPAMAAPGLPLPALSLATLGDTTATWQLATMQGQPWVLNLWASWCSNCAAEHAALSATSHRFAVVGLDVKDRPEDARAWLALHGSPYTQVLADPDGSAAQRLGGLAVPQTFVIDADGLVRWHHAGVVSAAQLAGQLEAARTKLRGSSRQATE